MKRFLALLVLLSMLPAAQAWWNKDWAVRKQVTLDTQAAAVAADADAVPVLVRLSTGNFDFLSAKEDGSDIRFVAQDDKTELKFHIERFDKANELAFVWVQVPRLAGSNKSQHVWLYAGNEKAAAGDGRGGYDAAQSMVFHLSETQGPPQDATANGHQASLASPAYENGGLIGGAVRLAGDGGMTVASAALQQAKEFTFSAWIRSAQADGELLAAGGLTLGLSGGVPVLTLGGAQARADAPLTLNTWHHVAVTVGQGATLYVDGKPAGTIPGAWAPTAELRIGAGLVGLLDEVQVAGAARPAAWLAAQVESQAQAGRLVQVGQEQGADSGEGASYFTATMRNVTPDGWVVVVLCVLMFVIAVWVMVVKAKFLSRVEKANAGFAKAFASTMLSLSALERDTGAHAGTLERLMDQKREFEHSPLLRIYEVGVRELKYRFAHAADAQGLSAVSARAIEAVRASLDAQLIREGQRMNRFMVLLTIAISGGPFLGLLGTVVGVMITFAAIAAAGDVNVNAIAPGIAASLVATVAGLGVAIPALFGYNYLMSRIKDISADMHVFVDEFVTKMAENYGD